MEHARAHWVCMVVRGSADGLSGGMGRYSYG
jgi:hypothetical protein